MSTKMSPKIIPIFLFLFTISATYARIHHLNIKDDSRLSFPLSHFGFLKNGVLDVRISNLTFTKNGADFPRLGLELERTLSDATTPYLDDRQASCAFDQPLKDEAATAHFLFDFEAKLLKVSCSPRMQSIARDNPMDDPRNKRNFMSKKLSDSSLFASRRRREPVTDHPSTTNEVEVPDRSSVEPTPTPTRCEDLKFAIQEVVPGVYSTKFAIHIFMEDQEGLYNLYFHNCGDNRGLTAINATMEVTESNGENYLSAGEMPLPRLYFVMSTVFLAAGCFWVGILCKSKKLDTYKIHYLMALLVYLKSLSLAFHGVNFHYIQTEGYHIEAWAVLYYITHLLKGAVLFITIILIGTGWAFVKHILSGKDKKIFMLVVPLQVLANVAYIITEESEAGQVMHMTWGEIFILVDLLCCGAILFPVVWSIRHLQEASQTDGKAAANLRKLKLFRHFYIMIVCYIYFTRIIVYLLKITVPFKYEWLDELFYELATFIFFVTTGVNFRPATNNPYLQLAKDDDDEMPLDEVVTQTGLMATVVHVNKKNKKAPTEGNREEHESLVNAESSHEYD